MISTGKLICLSYLGNYPVHFLHSFDSSSKGADIVEFSDSGRLIGAYIIRSIRGPLKAASAV